MKLCSTQSAIIAALCWMLTAARAAVMELPSEFDGRFFYVNAEIGGLKNLRLLIDTGASHLTISPRVRSELRRLGKLQRSSDRLVTTSVGKTIKINAAQIGPVKLGEFVLDSTTAYVLEMDDVSKVFGRSLDGIAGMNLFSDVTLTMDFPAGRASVAPDLSVDTNGAIHLACEFPGHVPKFTTAAFGPEIQFEIDTGYRDAFTVPLNTNNASLAAAPRMTGVSFGASGFAKIIQARMMTNVVWSGITFEQPIVELEEKAPALIGAAVLRHYKLTINEKCGLVLLNPATNRIAFPPVRSLGFAALPAEHGLKIQDIIPGTSAQRAGIRKGDYITAIDGKPAPFWNRERLDDLLDRTEPFVLSLRRPFRKSQVELSVQTLVE